MGNALDSGNLVPLGTRIEPWGTVSGITNMGGERYYFFVEKGVSLIPGVDVERHYIQQYRTISS